LTDITLTVTNEKGCDSTVVFFNRVQINEVWANFSTQSKMYCNNVAIQFTNNSTVYPVTLHQPPGNPIATMLTCEWDWGDGTRSQQRIASGSRIPFPGGHTYNFKQPITKVYITLRVKMDGADCEDEFLDSITIISPIADFTDDGHRFPCPGSTGKQIQFTDASKTAGKINYYIWNFGDSLSTDNDAEGATMSSASHLYERAGYYTVTLVVQDSILGCVDTMRKIEWVYIDGPSGSFKYEPLSGCAPLGVTFTATIDEYKGKLTADSLIWNPDGISPTVRTGPSMKLPHLFTFKVADAYLPFMQMIKWVDNNGTKEQCLVVVYGKDTIYAIDLKPDFVTDSLHCLDEEADMINTTYVKPSYLIADSTYWDFGNGDSLFILPPNSKDGQTVYNNDGPYKVTLIEHYKLCTQTKTDTVNVMPWPDIQFYPPDAVACDGMEVIFSADTALNPLALSRIAKYKWTFEKAWMVDSTTFKDTAKTKTGPFKELKEGLMFTKSNLYRYNLDITFTPKNCIKTWGDSVLIFAYESPKAEFTPNPPEVETGKEIEFIDKSTPGDGNIINWKWEFGYTGDEGSDEQNPRHVLPSGVWTVKMTITDEYGCSDWKEHEVTIMEKINFPNVFTPNGNDGRKYVFKPIEEKGYFREFRLDVYNRWGMLIWSQTCQQKDNPNCVTCCPKYDDDAFWWDGRNKQGTPVSDGVYYWVVYAKRMTSIAKENDIIQNGSVTVINSKK